MPGAHRGSKGDFRSCGEGFSGLPETLRPLIEARTGDAVLVVDPEYRIAYWDTRSEALTGFLAEEMLGKQCYELLLGEREDGTPVCALGCSIMRRAVGDRPVPSYDMRIVTASGERRWVNVSTISHGCPEGAYIVHLLRDSQPQRETLEMARSLLKNEEKSECSSNQRGNVPELTPRQTEILGLISEGRSTKEISRELHLSGATVRNHIHSLLKALGARSQLEALALARKAGLLSG